MDANELILTAKALGRVEAVKRNIWYLKWSEARDFLHQGVISQDDFDLFDDLWNVNGPKFSVSKAKIHQSEANLIVRFQKELIQIDQGRNENVNG